MDQRRCCCCCWGAFHSSDRAGWVAGKKGGRESVSFNARVCVGWLKFPRALDGHLGKWKRRRSVLFTFKLEFFSLFSLGGCDFGAMSKPVLPTELDYLFVHRNIIKVMFEVRSKFDVNCLIIFANNYGSPTMPKFCLSHSINDPTRSVKQISSLHWPLINKCRIKSYYSWRIEVEYHR